MNDDRAATRARKLGGPEYLVLGIISALAAGNSEAVHDMLRLLASMDATKAADIHTALLRGLAARRKAEEAGA